MKWAFFGAEQEANVVKFCEAWRKAGTRRGEPPEDKLDGHECPQCAAAVKDWRCVGANNHAVE